MSRKLKAFIFFNKILNVVNDNKRINNFEIFVAQERHFVTFAYLNVFLNEKVHLNLWA